MMRRSLTAPSPLGQPARSRGWGLAALKHTGRLHRPTALGPVLRQAPRAAAGSGGGSDSSGQPGSEAGAQQVPPLSAQPTRRQQQHEQLWQQAYSQVLAFLQAHGRLPGTSASRAGQLLEGEEELGMWCALQQRRKDGSKGPPLSAEEKAALQAIPGWEWGRARQVARLRKDWWQWLREVEAFALQHERLPRAASSASCPLLPEERSLGHWCVNQRSRYKGMRQPQLSPEQEAALAAIPGWYWEQYTQQEWEQQYQRVLAFLQQHDGLPRIQGSSSRPLVENEGQLGHWCKHQRQRYKGQRQPALSAEQEAALADIPGWYWEQQQPWEQLYQRVAAFQQQQGRLPRRTCSKSQPLLEDEQQLAEWCQYQRQRYKCKCQPPLSPGQEGALAAIPGWFWQKNQAWEQLCQRVAAFQQQHGRLPREKGGKLLPLLEGERQLGLWCNDQRKSYKGQRQPPLSPEQQAALTAIPGWFWEQYRQQGWEQQYQRVAAFQQQQGRLPRRGGSSSQPLLQNERQLGSWCDRQRQRYKGQQQPPLSPEQEAALAAIPGWFWAAR